MLTILGITSPIFILIAVGFGAVRSGILPRGEMRALGIFVVNFALPALLFKAMSQRAFGELLDLRLLLIYALGSLAAALLVIVYVWLIRKRSLPEAAVLAMGMSISNSAYIGFPMADQVLGSAASAMLAMYAFVETAIMLPVLMTLAELGKGQPGSWLQVPRRIFVQLMKNPMFLSILAGVVFSALGGRLPLPLARAIDLLSAASAPVALFYIGCILAGLSLKGLAGDLVGIVAGKLILHPLAVFAIFLVLPFGDPALKRAAILNAAMPMMSIYPIIGQKYGKEGLCAAALVAATVLSFFTISGLLWLGGA